MEIKILFDSRRINRSLFAGWGVSYLIGNKTLFDTGEQPDYLMHNIGIMGVAIDDIESVVISHDHFDHTGGLWGLLQEKPGLDLYVCPGFSRVFRDRARSYGCNITEVDSFTEIAGGIYSTGRIMGRHDPYHIAEQALALSTDKGLTVITGCAHPGIITILEYVMSHIKGVVHLVMGGFHMLDDPVKKIKEVNDALRELGVRSIGPSHCTGEDAVRILKESYAENFVDIEVGKTIEV